MSLHEPILGLLPATESDILSVNPRVNPDSLLNRLRRLERFGAVRRRRDGKYIPVERGEDKPFSETVGKRHNPVNASQLRKRTCANCGTTYRGIKQHFGDHHARVCIPCTQRRPPGFHGNSKGKVCKRCGEFRYPLGRQFREVRKSGQKFWTDICNTCWIGE